MTSALEKAVRNFFDLPGVAGIPWFPMLVWQEAWNNLARWQRLWLEAIQPGVMSEEGHAAGGAPTPISILAGMMPVLPRIEANIVPLPREGALAAADDAARLTMRLILPGLVGFGASEVLLVDAVVARATGEGASRLGSGSARSAVELPSGKGNS